MKPRGQGIQGLGELVNSQEELCLDEIRISPQKKQEATEKWINTPLMIEHRRYKVVLRKLVFVHTACGYWGPVIRQHFSPCLS